SAGSEFWRFRAKKILDHFSICACHPCAGAMLIFSVSFQFYRMSPKGQFTLFPWDQSSSDSDQFLDLCVSSLRKGHAFPWDQSSGDSDHFSICACHLCSNFSICACHPCARAMRFRGIRVLAIPTISRFVHVIFAQEPC
ncbi:hypothetical protein Tco_1269450, partial [Tanacetum coccineum]